MKWQTRDPYYMRDRNRQIMPLIEDKPQQTTDWPYWLIIGATVLYFAWQLSRPYFN